MLQAACGQAREQHQPAPGSDRLRTGQLLVTGIALSIDNLAIGFALGAYQVNLAAAAVIIGAVIVTLSLIGLELGDRLGTKTGERGELLGGLVLIAVVGIAISSGILERPASLAAWLKAQFQGLAPRVRPSPQPARYQGCACGAAGPALAPGLCLGRPVRAYAGPRC